MVIATRQIFLFGAGTTQFLLKTKGDYSYCLMDLPVPELLCLATLTIPGEGGAIISFSTSLDNY